MRVFWIEQQRSRAEARHYTGEKLRKGTSLKTDHYRGTYRRLCLRQAGGDYAARYLLAWSAIMISVQQSFIRAFMRG